MSVSQLHPLPPESVSAREVLERVRRWFDPPGELESLESGQQAALDELRERTLLLVERVVDFVPRSPEQIRALHHLKEAYDHACEGILHRDEPGTGDSATVLRSAFDPPRELRTLDSGQQAAIHEIREGMLPLVERIIALIPRSPKQLRILGHLKQGYDRASQGIVRCGAWPPRAQRSA